MVLGDFIEIIDLFTTVITSDPLTAILFVFGNILLLGSIAIFGLLTAGSILALVTPN